MIVLGFPENAAQSIALATELGCAHATIDVHRFPDGESRLQLPPSLPAEVVLFRTLDHPNEKLVELLIAAGGARELGAADLTLVAPYLCYMRQDIAFEPGQPVSQHIVGRLLAQTFDAVVTVDPHLHRVATLDEAVPASRTACLSAAPELGKFLCGEVAGNTLLLGPDEESAQWVDRVASAGRFDFDVARKQRLGDRQVRVTLPEADIAGRTVVLVDDVIASGHTMMEAARALRARGATAVHAIATHGLFADGALEGMRAAGINHIWTSDAIPHETSALPLAALMASGVRSSAGANRRSGDPAYRVSQSATKDRDADSNV